MPPPALYFAAAAFAPSTASGNPNAADWMVLMSISLIGAPALSELELLPLDEQAATVARAARAATKDRSLLGRTTFLNEPRAVLLSSRSSATDPPARVDGQLLLQR